jgi:hypothetical protein
MKNWYVLESKDEPLIYRSLLKLCRDIGRKKNYQSFIKILREEPWIKVDGKTIRRAKYVHSKRNN